jgi:hypothetical protein
VELIGDMSKNFRVENYLEIGVHAGRTFFSLDITNKVAVDPRFAFDTAKHQQEGVHFFQQSSDEFFAGLKTHPVEAPFDIIFIDGLHTFEQSFRDFENSLSFAHAGTIWILDDTVPCDAYSAVPDRALAYAYKKAVGVTDQSWHGDVFKTVFAIHDRYPEFSYCTLMDGNPKTIVWRSEPEVRTPLFSSLEEISRLNYFSILEHPAVFRPVNYEQLFSYVGKPWPALSESIDYSAVIYYKVG